MHTALHQPIQHIAQKSILLLLYKLPNPPVYYLMCQLAHYMPSGTTGPTCEFHAKGRHHFELHSNLNCNISDHNLRFERFFKVHAFLKLVVTTSLCRFEGSALSLKWQKKTPCWRLLGSHALLASVSSKAKRVLLKRRVLDFCKTRSDKKTIQFTWCKTCTPQTFVIRQLHPFHCTSSNRQTMQYLSGCW